MALAMAEINHFGTRPRAATLWPKIHVTQFPSGPNPPVVDVGACIQTYQVGAHFEVLTEGVLMAPLDPRYTQV